MTYIYFIRNIKTNYIYVGSTINIQTRWKDHIRELKYNRHHNKFLQRSWNRNGEEYFQFGILEITHDNYRFIREQYYIDSIKKLYNVNKNADKPPSQKGVVVTTSTREKLRAVGLGRKHTQETKNKLREQKLGKQKSAEHIQKLSEIRFSNPTNITTLDGELISPLNIAYKNITNIRKFCRDYNLNYNCLLRVINGKRESHYGWTYKKLIKESI